MTIFTNAIPGSDAGDFGQLVADVWDIHAFGTALRQPYNAGTQQPVGRVLDRVSGLPSNIGAGTDTFWLFQTSNLQAKYPDALQYDGTNRTRCRSGGGALELKCNYFPWQAGLDPASQGLDSTNIPFWHHIRVEYTVRKADAGALLICGWANGGGSLGDWTNPSSIGGMGFGLGSQAGQTTWTTLYRRGSPQFGAPVTATPIGPIDASVFQRLRFDVFVGPAFLMEFRIGDVLVGQLDVTEFSNLSGVNFDDMSMRHEIRSDLAMDGPYASRASIYKST